MTSGLFQTSTRLNLNGTGRLADQTSQLQLSGGDRNSRAPRAEDCRDRVLSEFEVTQPVLSPIIIKPSA
jgi:hypothetical protein